MHLGGVAVWILGTASVLVTQRRVLQQGQMEEADVPKPIPEGRASAGENSGMLMSLVSE